MEIETYTWSLLDAGGPEAVVDGLALEYAHVLERLASLGWRAPR